MINHRTWQTRVSDSITFLAVLLSGVAAAWLAQHAAPNHWSIATQIVLSAIAAVVAAATVGDGIQKISYRLLTRSTPPRTLAQALEEVTEVTEADAARRAAHHAFDLAFGHHFLRDPDLWCGYENGEAVHHLTEGIVLHFRLVYSIPEYSLSHTEPEFTLLSAESEERTIRVSTVADIRHYLAAAAAGLPISRDAGFAATAGSRA